MKRDHLLIIGALHPLGRELTRQLRKIYGTSRVITADLSGMPDRFFDGEPYEVLDLLDKDSLSRIISRRDITQIYLLATGDRGALPDGSEEIEKVSLLGLLNVLEVAREKGVARVFWPSSVSVFGADAPRWKCPQDVRLDPSTPHGLSRMTGESWCRHYWERFAVDVRSLRYPGILGAGVPAGELTDYVGDMLQHALLGQTYHCYLQENAILPMIYMPDAVRAAIEVMEAPATAISVRDAYNIGAISVSPREIALTIQRYVPGSKVAYHPDHRQRMAEETPMSVEDIAAVRDWRWDYSYGISETVRDMLAHLSAEMKPMSVHVRELNGAVFF